MGLASSLEQPIQYLQDTTRMDRTTPYSRTTSSSNWVDPDHLRLSSESDTEGEAYHICFPSESDSEEEASSSWASEYEKVYVALGKEVKDGKPTLLWALQNVERSNSVVVVLHVHRPSDHMIPTTVSQVCRDDRYIEREKMYKSLDEYMGLCADAKVRARKLVIEKDDVVKGILELISLRGINNLVMGTATDRILKVPKSRTAISVQRQADPSCNIWFVCKGELLCTSTEGCVADPCEDISRNHLASDCSTSPVNQLPGNSGTSLMHKDEESEQDSVMLRSVNESEKQYLSSTGQELEDVRIDNEIYKKLQEAITKAENLSHEVYAESHRRHKAESAASEAVDKAKTLENLYSKVLKRRKEVEETLARKQKEMEELKVKHDKVFEKLQKALKQESTLIQIIADSNCLLKDSERKLSAAQHLLSTLRQEHNELQQERENAVREEEKLRRREEEASTSTERVMNISEFSYSELEQATLNFDKSMKIGEGGYGSVYKGILRHTMVAIKMLNPQSMQGQAEFHQEVYVLSRVRHPHLVTLIGVCLEAWALIYEYCTNGSLEDRLVCKDNTLPLTWQARTRIAAEICSALIFLHSNKPLTVVHGDLNPANILIDANFVSKLGDFGISRLLDQSTNTSTLYSHTNQPKGTIPYIDPEFLESGDLTRGSDVYSFGIILLRIMTGRPARRLKIEVQAALNKNLLQAVLDPTAGDWPFVQAKQLAHLALRCCGIERKSRPDLALHVWKVMEPLMKSTSSAHSSSLPFRSLSDDTNCIPSYFICPIFQEIMRDPHIAADGFTYEVEALKGWLDSGHDTSPMTNVKLLHHDLIPNRALRSAIQEWLQQQK